MKKTLFFTWLSVTLFSSAALAEYSNTPEPAFVAPAKTSGFYLSAQGGWGNQFGWNNSNSIAGRVAFGYNLNRYVGFEAGAAKWFDVKNENSFSLFGDSYTLNNQYGSYSGDGLVKLTYPFDNGFRVFIKGGAAYVHTHDDIKLTNKTTGSAVSLTFIEGTVGASMFRPEAVGGLGYDFNEHWSADLAYSRIFDGWGPGFNMATVGITYNI